MVPLELYSCINVYVEYTVKCVIIGILFLLVFSAGWSAVRPLFLEVIHSYVLSPHKFRWQRIYWTNIRQHSMKAVTSKSASFLAFLGYVFSAVK